jgi:hypothetical protein
MAWQEQERTITQSEMVIENVTIFFGDRRQAMNVPKNIL